LFPLSLSFSVKSGGKTSPFAVSGRSVAFARTRPATLVIYSASMTGGFERQPLDHPSERIEKRDELLEALAGTTYRAAVDLRD
jgi:hypothetical protein